ncbi:uncharacterized protein LOC117122739 [Anneissia japonica]|uniref:uncharacterized protein LOC117122739 n=1 Tax=Anneissia japonica TaxID=1529436 RepID=UPI00142585D1|nr:uncharacterized protein LOC117122739 [Anneissia japonica]
MCIDEGFLCDGFPDCDNLYDESADTCNVTCPPSYFRCPFGLCTYDEYTCDEYPYDCLDNYDESPELCEGKCPVPDAPENGDLLESFAYTFYRNGTTVDFVCNDGYTLQGSKSSTCFDGTFLDIPTCHENCILPTPPVHGYVSGSTVHGENITFSCEGGFRPDVNSIVTAVCMDGQYTTTTIMCRDINECMEESDSCSVNAACINKLGSYRCECNFGYKGDGILCEDIDECANDTDTCAPLPAGSCANTIGSYNCSCNEGYRGDGEICIEIVLLPFGVENGDTSLRQEVGFGRDVISPNIEPLTGFPFGSTFYYNIYFTDNGVVVLSSVNAEKFSYPHPVIGGFQPSTSEQIIAPFWADADMSLEFGGDVFYQVYSKENPSAGTEEMLQTVTDQIRNSPVSEENSFDKTEFQAEWMLLITWYRLPQVPAFSYQNQTNTFQAVLVTDGTFGFTLFNYQINEMNWDAAVLDPMDVIIGYNARFRSTIDNVNAQLISSYFPNVLSRYRPDQIDGNSGLKARWIYRVERNYPWTVNTRQLCLNWYSTEPDPSEWDHRLGTCPCAFGQGRSDGGFGNGVRGRQRARRTTTVSSSPLDESLLTDINNLDGLPFCLQTSTPSRTGAGIRCCYRGDQSLVVGYGSFWQSSFVERYQPTSFFAFLNWIFEDLFPRYYCCTASRDPYFCGLFTEKRPAGSCDGYLPPNTGWMFGDPHMTTLDGYDYTYNGIGEYILEEVMLEDNQRFVVQCRMQPPILQTDSVAGATVFTSFVGAVDNGTKVEMRITENALDLDILVNGTAINKTALVEDSYTSDEDISFSVQLVDGELASGGARYLASWSDGVSFSVAVSSGMLNIVFQASVIYKGKARGLLGVWNDNVTDDFVERGKVEPLSKEGDVYTGAELFQFGNSWRISESESLFTYRPGESHDTINNETFVPKFLEDLVAENQGTELYSNAVQTCGDNSQCLFDSLATKDTSTGANTLETNDVITNDVQELMNFPPNITLIQDADGVLNGSYFYAIVGENYTFTVVATDENGDEITFSLLQPVAGASVDPTSGVLTWTPQDTTMIRLGVVASDGVANSTREFLTLLCDCKNGGTCNFGTVDDNSDILDEGFAVSLSLIHPCTCHPAYTGIDCSQDFNACADAPCYPGVLCTDNVAPDPNATCASCPSGLVGDGFKCYDYDECMVNNAGCDHLCSNTLGGFECSCSEGYSLQNDFMSCNDINECLQENDCSVNAFCTNDIGTYSCTCNTGYSGDGINCQDIDECIDIPCDQLATCENDEGSFTCTCLNGYQGNGLECTDINECEGNSFICDVNAECRNTAGSYKCACVSGYSGNGTFCTNVDECAMMTHQCSISATCEDTIGSYICTCEDGYTATGKACIDNDECQTGEHDCSVNGYCINTIGSYMCMCNDGYTMNNNTCDDKNECELSSPCDSIGSCENTDGSYICSCPSGYLIRDRVTCEDINECEINTHNCSHDCVNTNGSFTCACPGSLVLDGEFCLSEGNCSLECEYGACSTGVNGSECICNIGFELSNGNCTDVDECRDDGMNMCDELAVCNNTKGGYECICKEGYELLTGTFICNDINECSSTTSYPCHADSNCLNTIGSFNCTCRSGFNGDGLSCTDINECTNDENNNCDPNADCINNNGSFVCKCKSGFVGVGVTCFDVVECNIAGSCPDNSLCTNTVGSFNCTCNEGFAYNQTDETCDDINECDGPPTCSSNAKCSNTLGSYTCACFEGFRGDGSQCTDIDECEENIHDCDINAECANTNGSFSCVCNTGYEGNGTTCSDINECDTNSTTHDCDAVAICSNVVGSFLCTCDMGYIDTGAGKERDCQNIDECTVGIHNCDINAECNDTVGSFGCQCNDGYTGTGINCADENECDTNGTCPEVNTMCMNTDGGFFCSCSEGFSNISGICTEALSLNLPVIFTYIGGLEVGPNTKLTLTQKNTLVKDMSELLKTTSLSADLLDVMFMDSTNITEGLLVEFRIDLRIESGTNYTQLVTIFELATALNNGRVPPDNVIYAPPDVEPPVLTCVSAVTVTTDPGKATATVAITSPSVLDNSDEDIVATSSPSIPASLAIGVHTINFTAMDSAGNSGFCNVMVTVKDEETPSLVCAADWTVYINFGEASTPVDIPSPSVFDNSGETGDVTSEPSIPLNLGIGTHTFTFTTSDLSGNTGNCSVTVSIEAVNRMEMRLTFTGVNGLSVAFGSDLLNELSDRFILYQSYLCSAISSIVSDVLTCRVIEFRDGSIEADVELGFSDLTVAGNDVESELRNAAAGGLLVTEDNVTLTVDPSTIHLIGGTTVPMQTTDVPEDGGDNEATTVLVVVIVVACVLILFLIISSIACVVYRKKLTYRDTLNKNQYQTYSDGKVVRNPFHSLPRNMVTGSDSMTSEESMMYRISHTLRNSQMIPERESNFTLGTDEFVRPYMADGSEEMSGNDGYRQEYY